MELQNLHNVDTYVGKSLQHATVAEYKNVIIHYI